MGLLLLISTVLIAMLSQSSAMVNMGATKIQLHQRSRSAIARITPYLLTAVNGPGNGEGALVEPITRKDAVTPADLIISNSIIFHTTEDFLDENYDPDLQRDPAAPAWDPAAPRRLYQIRWDTSAGRTYITQGTAGNPSRTEDLGDIILSRLNPDRTVDTTVQPRVLATQVLFFGVYLITSNSVEIQVRTAATRKGPQGNQIDEIETESAIIPLPSQSLK